MTAHDHADEGGPVTRATRLARLAKLVTTTVAALVGIAKALGWL